MLSETVIALGSSLLAYASYGLYSSFTQLPRLKLQPDPIPRSMHWLNVRSRVSVDDWIKIKKAMKGSTKIRTPVCECCGAAGPLECHEVWEFTWPRTQKLTGLQMLCRMCHLVHHIGFAMHSKEVNTEEVIKHFMKVNRINRATANLYIEHTFRTAKFLNDFSPLTMSRQHRLDLTYLNKNMFGLMITFTTDERNSCDSSIQV
jgi:hypothetical protein